jgi:hypothetical protein
MAKGGEQVAANNGTDDSVAKAGAPLHEIWPLAVVGFALTINLVWIAALGYGFYRWL